MSEMSASDREYAQRRLRRQAQRHEQDAEHYEALSNQTVLKNDRAFWAFRALKERAMAEVCWKLMEKC